MKVNLKRIDDAYHMEASNDDGNLVYTDGSPAIGGGNKAMRPMQMVLAAVGSCSSIDVIMILKKQKEPLEDIQITVEGERHEDRTPKTFKKIHIHYKLFGDLKEAKAKRAINLSMETYCSVSIMLKASVEITYSYEIIR